VRKLAERIPILSKFGSLSFDLMDPRYPETRYQDIYGVGFASGIFLECNASAAEMRSPDRVVGTARIRGLSSCHSGLVPRSIVSNVEVYLHLTGTCKTILRPVREQSFVSNFLFDFRNAMGTHSQE
jgi:hypothetical protein